MTIKNYLESLKEEAKDSLNPISQDFAFDYECSDNNSYISDCFSEYADSQVDIYTNDLIKWVSVSHNYYYIEEYVQEYGMPENNNYRDFDFIKLIQLGQWYENYETLSKDEDEIKALIYVLKLLQLDDEILEQELDEELQNNIDNILSGSWCDLDRFCDYEDLINETFGWE